MSNELKSITLNKTATSVRFIGLCFYVTSLISAGLFFISFTTHRSSPQHIFERYSLSYSLFLLMMGVALAALLLLTFRYWFRLPNMLVGLLTRVPSDGLYVVAIIVVTSISWLCAYPLFGVMTTIWFIAGSITLLVAIPCLLIMRLFIAGLEPQAIAAVWSFVFASILFTLIAYLGFDSELLRWLCVTGGPLLGYAIFRCIHIINAGKPRWVSTFKELLTTYSAWFIGVSLAGLALIIAFGYREITQQSFMNGDELHLIDFVRVRPLLTAVFTPMFSTLFRPLFQLQAYIVYTIFGLDHSGYAVAQLGLLWLSASALFISIIKITKNILLACMLTMVVVVHRFVSYLVIIWAIDTITFSATLAVVVLYLSSYSTANRVYYLTLGLMLLLGCISRENGLLSVLGVGFGALSRFLLPNGMKPRAVKELLLLAVVVLTYFLLRRLWIGNLLPGQFFLQETCLGFDLYEASELASFSTVRQVMVFGYTVMANLTAFIFPAAINDVGCIQWPGIQYGFVFVAILSSWIVTGLIAEIWLHREGHRQALSKVLMVMLPLSVIIGGPILVFASKLWPHFDHLEWLDLWLYSAITFLALYAFTLKQSEESSRSVAIANILGAVLGAAVLSGFYFRYRNFYSLIFYWAILIAICWHLAQLSTRGNNFFKSTLVVLLLAAIGVNIIRINHNLPMPALMPENFNANNKLCSPWISDELALAISRQDSLEDEVAACRIEAVCDLSNWPSPTHIRVKISSELITAAEC
jgi:hypothetical protein